MTEIYYIVRDKNYHKEKELYWIKEDKYLCLTTPEYLDDDDIKTLSRSVLPQLIGDIANVLQVINLSVVDYTEKRLWIVPECARSEDEVCEKVLKLCVIDVNDGPATIKSHWSSSQEEGDNGISIIRHMSVHGGLYFVNEKVTNDVDDDAKTKEKN